MKIFKLSLVLGVALLYNSHFVWAEEPPGEPQAEIGQQSGEAYSGRRHPGPPPEAYAACAGKSPGAAASFTNRRGETRNGICQADEKGNLVVRRDRSPGQQ